MVRSAQKEETAYVIRSTDTGGVTAYAKVASKMPKELYLLGRDCLELQ